MRYTNAPTLQDVAREAGVSAMTASAALHGGRSSTRVSEATRARIQEVAMRLRYRTNGVARGLSRRRMDTIGIIAGIETVDLNLYFLEVLNGVLEGAAQHDQNVTVFSVSDWKQEEGRILKFCDGRVDGMILIATPALTPAFAEVLHQHTPFVTIHGNCPVPHTINLDNDDEGGAYSAVKHLTDLGHRRIAYFPGAFELRGPQKRLAGYQRALAEANIDFDEALVIAGTFDAPSGIQRMTQLIETYPLDTLPTAIFCANDQVAAGCMEVLAKSGLKAPDDISIVGFDDSLSARMTSPPLTTVRQPFRQMGIRAVELLLLQIGVDTDTISASEPMAVVIDEDPATVVDARSEVFPVTLVVRGSSGPPR